MDGRSGPRQRLRKVTGGFLAAILLSLLAVQPEAGSPRLCTGKNATLSCLKKHFDELYRSDYAQFFDILYAAEKRAIKCDSRARTSDFLDVVRFIKGNAEVGEYFSETIERLCTTRSRCLFDALSAAHDETQSIIIRKLRTPTFLEERAITAAFLRHKKDPKYKVVMDAYFAP